MQFERSLPEIHQIYYAIDFELILVLCVQKSFTIAKLFQSYSWSYAVSYGVMTCSRRGLTYEQKSTCYTKFGDEVTFTKVNWIHRLENHH